MDGEKRKHEDDGEVESKSVKPEEEKDVMVTEEEVEEFFTILKRIHEATRQYGQPDGEGGRKLTTSKEVRRYTRSRNHDWTDCPFAHPGEKARCREKVSHYWTDCPSGLPPRNNPAQPWPIGRPLRFEPSASASYPKTQRHGGVVNEAERERERRKTESRKKESMRRRRRERREQREEKSRREERKQREKIKQEVARMVDSRLAASDKV